MRNNETKIKRSIRELAIVQSTMLIDDSDRLRVLRAMESLRVAEEMYAMLESVLSEMHSLLDEVNDQRCAHINPTMGTPPDLHDGQTLHEIQLLLAKARGAK